MTNKAVLITGASGGIGKALCEAFADDGYRVVATDKEFANGITCDSFIQQDLEELVRPKSRLKQFEVNVLQEIDSIAGSLNPYQCCKK